MIACIGEMVGYLVLPYLTRKPMNTFEVALLDLARATDSDGLPIVLFHRHTETQPPTAGELREATQAYVLTYRMEMRFIHPHGEQTYLRNLCLLANATSAAIAYESAEGAPPAMQGRYKEFSIPCDVSPVSMQDAANYLGPSFMYEIHVNPVATPYVRRIIREIGAASVPHPFAPAFNLIEDDSLARDEWFLSANGRAMGSPVF